MLLSAAMHILLSKTYCLEYLQLAKKLLVLFMKHFGELYGQDMLTYNVHGLVHLPAEAKKYGPLDSVSCFPFENFLGQLKKIVRKPAAPLEQVVRRLSEECETSNKTKQKILQKTHVAGPLPSNVIGCSQFKELHQHYYILKISEGDNCFLIGSDIAVVRNFFTYQQNDYVVFERFHHMEDFFSYPIRSISLGIFTVARLTGQLQSALVADIVKKYILLPHKQGYVAVPFLH